MNTREKILDTTRRFLQTRGYRGFSFQDIADNVGIKKASLYHHFKSKDDVAMEALRLSNEALAAELEKVPVDEPARRLEKYFALVRVTLGAGERMCPGCSFAASLDAVSPTMQGEVQTFVRFHLDWLEDTLKRAKKKGEIQFDRSPKAESEYVFASVQGAVTLGRLTSNAKVLDNVIDHLRESFSLGEA